MAQNKIIQPKSQVFSYLASQFSFSNSLRDQLLKEFDQTLHDFSEPFPGAHESLDKLKNSGASVGCITNGRDFFQRKKIRALGFEPYFDFIVTSGETGIKKPDPEIFRMGLDQLRKNSGPTSFCGDSLSADIKPAKQLGLTTIWKTKDATRSNFADYTFDDFSDFDDICETIRRRSYLVVKE